MKRIILLVFLTLTLAIQPLHAQTAESSPAAKAADFLQKQGLTATGTGESVLVTFPDFEVSVNYYPGEKISLMRMSSQLASYRNATDHTALMLANELNTNVPIFKFVVSAVQLGDFALIEGGDPNEVIYNIEVEADQSYTSEESMLQILDDYIKGYQELKKAMPSTLSE